MILIELVFDAPPGEQENVANLARRTTAATRRENGCILYRFTAGLDHPSRFILTELWESEEHLKLTSQAKHSRTSGLNYPGRQLRQQHSVGGQLISYVPPNLANSTSPLR